MESMRFICGRILPTIRRSQFTSLQEATRRAFCTTILHRNLLLTSNSIVVQCRFLPGDSLAVAQQRLICNKYCSVFSIQRQYIVTSSVLLRADKSSGTQTQSTQRQNVTSGTPQPSGVPPKSDKSDESDSAEDVDDLFNNKGKKRSLFVRFKESFKKYWYVMLPVHFVTSWMFLGGFYYLATCGLSPAPLLEYWGVPDKYVSRVKDSSLGYLAVGVAFYKLATPIRYLTTLGLSGVTVKILGKRGLLPSSAQMQAILKNRMQGIKDKKK